MWAAVPVLWLASVAVGTHLIWRYAGTPGPAAEPPPRWPAASGLRQSASATLVMLAHPRCPCTRASISDLTWIMSRCQGRLSAYVLFSQPAGAPEGWEKSDLWSSAAAIPGVTVVADVDDEEARLFDASTSGQVVLYGADGRLLFRGGITAGRGHPGANAGRDAILALVDGGRAEIDHRPVYGCGLAPVAAADAPAEEPP